MTTLEDLYVYYCRRCECKPNSMLCNTLRSAYEAAHGDRSNALTELDLSLNYIGPKGLEPVLLLCRGLYSLRTLRLCHNRLSTLEIEKIVEYLAEGVGGGDSNSNNAADEEDAAPRPARRSQLSTLDLRSNLIHDGSVPRLLYLLRSSPHITSLLLEDNPDLSRTFIDGAIAEQLAQNQAAQDKEAAEHEQIQKTIAEARAGRGPPKQLPHRAILHGELTKTTSGGYFEYPTWRRNPQYSLRVSHDAPIRIDLDIITPEGQERRTTRQYGFVVMRGHAVLRVIDVGDHIDLGTVADAEENKERVIIAESSFHESHTTLTLPKCEATMGDATPPYIIMVTSFTPGKTAQFTLTAQIVADPALLQGGGKDGETKVSSVVDTHGAYVVLLPIDPQYDWLQYEVHGEWRCLSRTETAAAVTAVSGWCCSGGDITSTKNTITMNSTDKNNNKNRNKGSSTVNSSKNDTGVRFNTSTEYHYSEDGVTTTTTQVEDLEEDDMVIDWDRFPCPKCGRSHPHRPGSDFYTYVKALLAEEIAQEAQQYLTSDGVSGDPKSNKNTRRTSTSSTSYTNSHFYDYLVLSAKQGTSAAASAIVRDTMRSTNGNGNTTTDTNAPDNTNTTKQSSTVTKGRTYDKNPLDYINDPALTFNSAGGSFHCPTWRCNTAYRITAAADPRPPTFLSDVNGEAAEGTAEEEKQNANRSRNNSKNRKQAESLITPAVAASAASDPHILASTAAHAHVTAYPVATEPVTLPDAEGRMTARVPNLYRNDEAVLLQDAIQACQDKERIEKPSVHHSRRMAAAIEKYGWRASHVIEGSPEGTTGTKTASRAGVVSALSTLRTGTASDMSMLKAPNAATARAQRVAKGLRNGFATLIFVLGKLGEDGQGDTSLSEDQSRDDIGFHVVTPDHNGRFPMHVLNSLEAAEKELHNTHAGGKEEKREGRWRKIHHISGDLAATQGALVASYTPGWDYKKYYYQTPGQAEAHGQDVPRRPRHTPTVTFTLEMPLASLDFFIIPTMGRRVVLDRSGSNKENFVLPYSLQVFATCALDITASAHPQPVLLPPAVISELSSKDNATDEKQSAADKNITLVPTNPVAAATSFSSQWSYAEVSGRFDEARCGGYIGDNIALTTDDGTEKTPGNRTWTHSPSLLFEVLPSENVEKVEKEQNDLVVRKKSGCGVGVDICLSLEPTCTSVSTEDVAMCFMVCKLVRGAPVRAPTSSSVTDSVTKPRPPEDAALLDVNYKGTIITVVPPAGLTMTSTGGAQQAAGGYQHRVEVLATSSFVSKKTTMRSAWEVAVAQFQQKSSSTGDIYADGTIYLANLPPGQYFIVIMTKQPGIIAELGYRLRCYSSGSHYRPLPPSIQQRHDKLKAAVANANTDDDELKRTAATRALAEFEASVPPPPQHSAYVVLGSTDVPFSDRLRAQQVADYKEETLEVQRRALGVSTGPSTTTGVRNKASQQQKQKQQQPRLTGSDSWSISVEDNSTGSGVFSGPGMNAAGDVDPFNGKRQFAGCNVNDYLRQGKQYLDRAFPPAGSSLMLDTAALKNNHLVVDGVTTTSPATETGKNGGGDSTHYHNTTLSTGRSKDDVLVLNNCNIWEWRRCTTICRAQQQQILTMLEAAEGIIYGGKGDINGSGATLLDGTPLVAINRKERAVLEQQMRRRHAALGSLKYVAGGMSAVLTNDGSSLFKGDNNPTATTSAALAQYRHLTLPPLYLGCTSDSPTHLRSSLWYLSALGCIVTKPRTFAARCIGGYNADAGVAQFRFFINGKWQNIVIDDYIPVDTVGDACFTVSLAQGDVLAPLIEKAYAKAHRCYEALAADRGMVKKLLVGAPPAQTLQPRPPSSPSSVGLQPPAGRMLDDQTHTLTHGPAAADLRTVTTSGVGASTSGLREATLLTTDVTVPLSARRPSLPSHSAPPGVVNPRHTYTASSSTSNNKNSLQLVSLTGGGEPALVMLAQALTDFTGGIVSIYDITPPTVSQLTGDSNTAAYTEAISTVSSSKKTAILGHISGTRQQDETPVEAPATPSYGLASTSNNGVDSSAYFMKGVLPPHIATAISGSLYIDEDTVTTRRDAVWAKIMECCGAVCDDGDEEEGKKHSGESVTARRARQENTILAAGMLRGATGWQQKKHCGLLFDALYPIVEAREAEGRRLVKLFNNWGNTGAGITDRRSSNSYTNANTAPPHRVPSCLWWKGKYAWGAPVVEDSGPSFLSGGSGEVGWTTALKEAVGYDVVDSATTFWVSLEELMYYFSHLVETRYAEHQLWVEGGYGADNVGGSPLSTSWINNHQYMLTIHGNSDSNSNSNNEDDFVEVTIGIHQPNARSVMSRTRDAQYTYASAPVGVSLIGLPAEGDSSRRLAVLTSQEKVLTLFPAAVRDRYVTIKVPRSATLCSPSTTTGTASSKPAKYILMPFTSVNPLEDVITDSDTRGVTRDRSDAEEHPLRPRHGVQYYLSAHCDSVPCGISLIPDDTNTLIEGEWKGPTAGGPPSHGTWRNNPQYLLYPSENCTVTIVLRQRNAVSSTAEHIGFVVVDGKESHLTRLTHLEGHRYNDYVTYPVAFDSTITGANGRPHSSTTTVNRSTRHQTQQEKLRALVGDKTVYDVIPNKVLLRVGHHNDHSVSGTVRLLGMGERRGAPYHIVPSCLTPGAETGFTLEVVCNKKIKVTPVPPERDWKSAHITAKLSLTEGNCGGCVRYSTWRNNPQYLLNFPYESTGTMLLSVTARPTTHTNNRSTAISTGNGGDVGDPIGVCLFRADKWDKGRRRKVLLSDAAAEPVSTRFEQADGKKEEGAAEESEATKSRRGPAVAKYRLINDTATTLPLLEEHRAEVGQDLLCDTGVAPRHSEIFYNFAVDTVPCVYPPLPNENQQDAKNEEGAVDDKEEKIKKLKQKAVNVYRGATQYRAPLILMPYTLTPLTEVILDITILSTATIEVSPVQEYQPLVVAEGKWDPGVSAGGCRALHNSWINNPFYGLNLLQPIKPTRIIIIALFYAAGPEKPYSRRVGQHKLIVPPTTATVSSLLTRLPSASSLLTEKQQLTTMTSTSTTSPIRGSRMGNTAESVIVTSPHATTHVRNSQLHNTHTSVASRSSFGIDIVSGDDIYTPVASSRHTHEGETAILFDALLPCRRTCLPYYIVPHTRESEMEGFFKLLVYSDHAVQLTELKKAKRFW